MNFAVIGSGGREHAICYKLKQSKKIGKLICLPGNAGTKKIAKNIEVDISNFNLIYEVIKDEKINITYRYGRGRKIVHWSEVSKLS